MLRFLIVLSALLLTACEWGEGTLVQGYVYQEPIYMTSTQSGTLFTLNVERGQSVAQNQLLFALDPAPQNHDLIATKQQLLQAESTLMDLEKASRETVLEGLRGSVAQARAALEIAQKKANRYQELWTRKVIDTESRDEATADRDEKHAALMTAEANLAEAELGARVDAIKAQRASVESLTAQVASKEWALSQKTVIAPKDALVVDTFYRPGENVQAGYPVVELYDPNRLFAIFFISEPLLSEICLGQEISVAHDQADDKVKAVISYISPQAEYTPPVIYSRENNQILVFRVQATLSPEELKSFHAGQPIDVYVKKDKSCHEKS
ncbi:MAG: HlyD family efflux transporter periplasmic adaptor subunit [Legionellales bacterium]|jgi:HlyD family secretion protein